MILVKIYRDLQTIPVYFNHSNDKEGGKRMELDTSILEKQQNTTTTMADLYGYSVFSQDFLKKLEVEQAQAKKEQEHYFNAVFTKTPEDETGQAFERVMTANMGLIVKDDLVQEGPKGLNNMWMASFAILGALLAGAVWLYIEKVRKGKRVRENNNNNH